MENYFATKLIHYKKVIEIKIVIKHLIIIIFFGHLLLEALNTYRNESEYSIYGHAIVVIYCCILYCYREDTHYAIIFENENFNINYN